MRLSRCSRTTLRRRARFLTSPSWRHDPPQSAR
jgi:hypothetical protein